MKLKFYPLLKLVSLFALILTPILLGFAVPDEYSIFNYDVWLVSIMTLILLFCAIFLFILVEGEGEGENEKLERSKENV